MRASNYIIPGTKFSRLTVINMLPKNNNRESHYFCICECGAERNILGSSLKNGNTKSCGCYQKDQVRKAATRHGMSHTKIHHLWKGMMSRCYSPANFAFEHYGQRGITVCEKWHTFENFFEDMGERPPGRSLDRIDNNGPYSPENCRWATRAEQARNKRSNRVLGWRGEEKVLSDWAKCLGISGRVIAHRLDILGWDIERTLSKPARSKRSSKFKPA